MSIRRLVQAIVFVATLTIALSAPIASSTAYACPPEGGSGLC
jgi:hypothetical protein